MTGWLSIGSLATAWTKLACLSHAQRADAGASGAATLFGVWLHEQRT